MTDTQPSGAESAPDFDKLQAIADRADANCQFKTSGDIREWIALARRATAPHAAAQPVEPVGGALVANDVVYSYECRQPFTDVWPEFTGRTKPDLNDDDIRNVREYHAAPATGALVAKALAAARAYIEPDLNADLNDVGEERRVRAEAKEVIDIIDATTESTAALKQPHQEPVGHVKDHFKGTDEAYRTVIWADRTFAMDVHDGAPLFAAPIDESTAAPADLSKLRESLKEVADVLEAFGDLPDELMSDEKWHEHQAWQKLSRARELLEPLATPTGETQQPTTQGEGNHGS